MVGVLEGETKDKDRYGHDGGREPDYHQAGFWLNVVGVPTHVIAAYRVMKPVAEDCANDGTDDGGEVEEAWNQTKALFLTYR